MTEIFDLKNYVVVTMHLLFRTVKYTVYDYKPEYERMITIQYRIRIYLYGIHARSPSALLFILQTQPGKQKG